MEASKELEKVSQTLAKTKTPGHNNHHDDPRDRCPDCSRPAIMPNDKLDDIIADEEPYYCVCHSESEDIGSDDGNESSTVTAGVQPQSLLLSGDGTELQHWDLSAIKAQAMMQAQDYERQIKEAVEQFENQVNQVREENVRGVDRLNRLIELESERKQGQEVVENGDAEDGDAEDGDAEDGNAEDGDAENRDAENRDAEDGDAEDGDAKDGDTNAKDGNAEDGDAEDGNAENGDAEDGDAEDALDRQMAQMGREKRPRSPSPDGSDMDGEPPCGRARLGSRPLSSDAVVD